MISKNDHFRSNPISSWETMIELKSFVRIQEKEKIFFESSWKFWHSSWIQPFICVSVLCIFLITVSLGNYVGDFCSFSVSFAIWFYHHISLSFSFWLIVIYLLRSYIYTIINIIPSILRIPKQVKYKSKDTFYHMEYYNQLF